MSIVSVMPHPAVTRDPENSPCPIETARYIPLLGFATIRLIVMEPSPFEPGFRDRAIGRSLFFVLRKFNRGAQFDLGHQAVEHSVTCRGCVVGKQRPKPRQRITRQQAFEQSKL